MAGTVIPAEKASRLISRWCRSKGAKTDFQNRKLLISSQAVEGSAFKRTNSTTASKFIDPNYAQSCHTVLEDEVYSVSGLNSIQQRLILHIELHRHRGH